MSWHLDADTTVGTLISRGYNGGGAAYGEDTGVTTNYQFDPECVWTQELFGHMQLDDACIVLTANVFYSDYKDMQLTYDLTPSDLFDYSYVVTNGRRVETWGAELGSVFHLTEQLEVYANAGGLKTDITSFSGSGYQGHDLPNSPAFSLSGGISWKGYGWDANLNARYSDSYCSDLANQPRGKVDPYWLANTQLGYTLSKVRIYGQVVNLLDSDRPLAIYPGETRAEDGANLPQPRTYTVGMEMNC